MSYPHVVDIEQLFSINTKKTVGDSIMAKGTVRVKGFIDSGVFWPCFSFSFFFFFFFFTLPHKFNKSNIYTHINLHGIWTQQRKKMNMKCVVCECVCKCVCVRVCVCVCVCVCV